MDTRFAPYYPTAEHVAERMLKLGGLQPGERMFDLGSGDGRIVIQAAREFGAEATGVEIDPDLVRQSRARIAELGLDGRARIVEGDFMSQDYRSADVVTIYLTPRAVAELRPLLELQLKPGARVVVNSFNFENWTADEEVEMPDPVTMRRMLYLYRR
ncbi:MAG: class I SAM-dependent methyltransferase [Bryobacteraceae bacterium]|nr:class I SAM-dependent methyltransferase [Bryobacteraceae bacterium]